MRDFEAFQAALAARQSDSPDDGPAYMMSLMNSMSLVLDEFYKHLRVRPSLSPYETYHHLIWIMLIRPSAFRL